MPPTLRLAVTASLLVVVSACGQAAVTNGPTTSAPSTGSTAAVASAAPTTPAVPPAQTFVIDTDVAPDDLVALAFMLRSPNVTVAGITVSGTGEAHCQGGVAVVLGLLEYLQAPAIPVACGRETPLAGDHAFPDAWREGADRGSGLVLPATDRVPVEGNAVELIRGLVGDHPGLAILTLGPLTNLADALGADPGLAGRLGPIFVMGGALHVPGNLVGPGAPTGNTVAEWNIYVDPHAAQLVVDAGLDLRFVSLDGTSQVPVTPEFVRRAIDGATTTAAGVLADLLIENPFMADGSYFLWDPLAAELAAGYQVGMYSPAAIKVEETEGAESGFTRPTDGDPNIQFLSSADQAAAESTLLTILNGR